MHSKNPSFMQGPGGRILVTVASIVIIWGLIYLALAIDFPPLGIAVVALCVYFGWRALNNLQDTLLSRLIVILPIGGWVIFLVIKFLLAAMIGLFVAPFVLGRKVGERFEYHMNN